MRTNARQALHPIKGQYIEFEPFLEDIVQDIVLKRVKVILDTRPKNFAQDLKNTFKG